jgi:hypothetical protein
MISINHVQHQNKKCPFNFLEKWLNIYDYEEFKLTAPFTQKYHKTSG